LEVDVLQGTLDTFELSDVLALLARTAKSGRLHMGGEQGTGSVWFEEGEVVAASATNMSLDGEFADVVFELLRYDRGEFSFHPGQAAAEPGPPQAVAPLLRQASEQLAEWRALTAVIPTLSNGIVLVTDLVNEQVTLDRAQWRTVLAVGAGATAQQLGHALGLGEVPVLRQICKLLDQGLVQLVEPEPRAGEQTPRVGAKPVACDGEQHPSLWFETKPADSTACTAADVLEQLGDGNPRDAQAVGKPTSSGASRLPQRPAQHANRIRRPAERALD
jgi:hypothetical protein